MKRTIIFVFGLKMAGKTTIVNYLDTHKIEMNLTPTIAILMNKLKIKEHDYLVLDAPGQEKLHYTWKEGFEKAELLVFVVDVANKEEIPKSKQILESFMGKFEKIATPMVICLHKTDLLTDRTNIEYAKKVFHLNNKIKLQRFFLETTIKSPFTMDLLRVTFELLSNSAFLEKKYDFLTSV